MGENIEENEFGLSESEPHRRSHKHNQPVSSGIPVILFLFLCLVTTAMFGLIALVPLGIAAVVFLLLRERILRLPIGFYAIVFLLLGYLTWNFLSSGPVNSNPVASWIYQHSGLDMRQIEQTVVVKDDDFLPAKNQTLQGQQDSLTNEANKGIEEKTDAENRQGTTPSNPETPNDVTAAPANETPAAPPVPNAAAVNNFINQGLKAVDEEQPAVANQNFKNAFKANPRDPRLQQLAAEFRKTADEKCEDFHNANAKELSHIPNNYYQYAASLTQTVPLKCD